MLQCLFDADQEILNSRNYQREHILNSFWINTNLLSYQNIFLEKFYDRCTFEKTKIDTTNLSKDETYRRVCTIIENKLHYEEPEK